jgi:hypothetical protein
MSKLFDEKKFRESLPPEMLKEKRWVRYFLSPRPEGGTAKIPLGSHSDPSTWSSFDEAVKAIENDQQGLGYNFLGGEIHGLDIDHCRNPKTHQICNEAMLLLSRLPTWAEFSVSGQGIHVLFKGNVRGKQLTETCLQFWHKDKCPRFFAMTCDMVGEAFIGLRDVGGDFNFVFAQARHISAKIREELEKVDNEQWKNLPAEREVVEPVTREKSKTKTRKVVADFDLKDFLSFYSLEIDNETDNELGHCVRITTCPFKGSAHVGQNSTSTNFIFPTKDGGLAFHCQSTGCADYGAADAIKKLAKDHEPYPHPIYENTSADKEPYKVTLSSKPYDVISDEALQWLIEDYLPLASEVYLFAPKGRGKTKVCDYFNVLVNQLGKRVLRFNLEDMPSQILKPGLHAAGGNLKLTEWMEPNAAASKDGKEYPTRIDFSQEPHVAALKDYILSFGDVGLVIIEPINNYKGKAKAISEDDMRPIHTNIAQCALDCNVCILVVSHTNRKKDVDVLEKSHGAGSGPNVARVNLFLDKNPNDPEERVLTDAGSNVKVGPSKVFKIVEQPPFELGQVTHKKIAIAVLDRHDDTITAQEMLEDTESTKQTVSRDIGAFLAEFMTGKGELLKDAVVKAAMQQDRNWTLANIEKVFSRRMKKHGSQSRTQGGGKNKQTYWSLDNKTPLPFDSPTKEK